MDNIDAAAAEVAAEQAAIAAAEQAEQAEADWDGDGLKEYVEWKKAIESELEAESEAESEAGYYY